MLKKKWISRNKIASIDNVETWLGGDGNPLRIMQDIELWPYELLAWVQPRIRAEEWDAQNSLGFLDTNRSPNPDQKTKSRDSQKKKRKPAQ